VAEFLVANTVKRYVHLPSIIVGIANVNIRRAADKINTIVNLDHNVDLIDFILCFFMH
jgi:hypothetical protein